MPELPEVETVRRGLLKQLRGTRVEHVIVERLDSIGYPDARAFKKNLVGHAFEDIDRRGKYLILHLSKGAHLAVHLRMSGRLLVTRSGVSNARESHVRVRMKLSSGEQLIFEDMRVFGRLWYVSASENIADHVSGLSELGVEPLSDLTPKYLQAELNNKKQPIKATLLDQTIIAGIGNIYADEALHRARINPLRQAKDLNSKELAGLCESIISVLETAITLGGSTLRNYTDSSGVNGNYQQEALVYGRTGRPCHTCKSEIARVKIGGRSSHFCPKCQKAPRHR